MSASLRAGGVLVLLIAACARGPAPVPAAPVAAVPEVDLIAFGSCNQQAESQAFWDRILAVQPDLFIAAGDNVYADVHVGEDGKVRLLPGDLGRVEAAYAALAAAPEFQRFRASVPILPTWDDHDYGENDAGAELVIKPGSQRAFLDFWQAPADDPRRSQAGVWHAVTYGPVGRRVQVILLDTRGQRGPLRAVPAPEGQLGVRYAPSEDPTSFMLGEDQWAWLEGLLRQPAEVRLIVSSIQVIADRHPFERWGNLPHEQARLFALIARTQAAGVVLLSGDRHVGGYYRWPGAPYAVPELTSSSLNRTFGRDEEDATRVGPLVIEDNFGTVLIDWAAGTLALGLRSAADSRVLREEVLPIASLAPTQGAPPR